MKQKSAIALAIVLVLTIAVGTLAITGAQIGKYRVLPVFNAIRLGLDLRGGIYAVYEANDTTIQDYDTLFKGTISVLRNRLSAKGFNEATVVPQGNNRIRIEIPDVKNPDEILKIIGTPARLEFIDPEGTVVLTGADVKIAAPGYGTGMAPVVEFELNDSGRSAFAASTTKFIGQIIRIVLDGNDISTPRVETPITEGKGQITGMQSRADAESLAMLIQSGALPLDITQIEVSAVSATLGVDALSRSMTAGLIGVMLVMLFMLCIYRLSGLVADLALSIYIIIVFFLLAIVPGVQLTLPGIAGIVLSIGMAVDANVIIFERFREEVHAGRSLDSAVQRGFSNALSAIIDSNVTTLIAAFVLMYFGTGPIRGFAITLSIGVITSMFSAVVITRFLLTRVVRLGVNNPKLYVR